MIRRRHIKPKLRGHKVDFKVRMEENATIRQEYLALAQTPGFNQVAFAVAVRISEADLRVWLNDNLDFGVTPSDYARLRRLRKAMDAAKVGDLQIPPSEIAFELQVQAQGEYFRQQKLTLSAISKVTAIPVWKLQPFFSRTRLRIDPRQMRRLTELYDFMRGCRA